MLRFRSISFCMLVALGCAVISLSLGSRLRAADPQPAPTARGPLPPPGFIDACLDLIRDGRYAEAQARLAPVAADHPGWGRIHFYLGLAYHKDQLYGRARPLFERSIELEPDYRPATFYLGWALYYLGEPDKARQRFTTFLEHRPDYADAIFALGLIDFDADDVSAAERRFRRAVEIATVAADTAVEAKSRARLADVLIRVGKLDAARAELERSVELAPHNHEAWHKLSLVHERLGDSVKAAAAREQHGKTLKHARSGS